jgi:crossover junction endodeoxyribonuclease RuvC
VSRICIGIDPGLGGAVAILDGDDVTFRDTPTVALGGRAGKRREYLPVEMVGILSPYQGRAVVALEAVSTRRGEGRVSALKIGRGAGLWEGIVAALGLPCEIVHPHVWKQVMLAGMGDKASKSASRLRAQQLFPGAAGELARVKDHGRAEALLLAEYVRRRGLG